MMDLYVVTADNTDKSLSEPSSAPVPRSPAYQPESAL